ncbi:MAG TPA: hypothetical protein PKV80_24170, partial [Leptospiraceae bacterium]|nr:hypothetical protein [Leptospiraceae bacterium]
MKIYFILMICILSHCQKAVFNSISDGAGGLILGTSVSRLTGRTELTVSGKPDSLDEGKTAVIGIKFTKRISSKTVVTVQSRSSALTVNNGSKAEFAVSPEESLLDKNVKLQAIEDGNRESETVSILISASGYPDLEVSLKINDLYARKVSLTLPDTTAEGISANLFVSLGIKPESNVSVTLTASDPSVSFPSGSSLTFTKENYDTIQSVQFTINDIFNDSRSYSITAVSDLENNTKSTLVEDNDFAEIDISGSVLQGTGSGSHPSVLMDDVNGKLLTATYNQSNAGKPSVYRCSMDGSGCIHYDVSSGMGLDSGRRPNLNWDKNADKLVLFSMQKNVFKCDTDVTNCSSLGGIASNLYADFPYLIYPSASSSNVIVKDIRSVFYCDGNFSICSVDSANPSNFASYAYGSRRGIIDSLNSKIITSHTNVSTYAPRIVRWDLNSVTNPVPIDLSSVTNSAITTDLVIDALNSKLLVVSSNFSIPGGKAWLFRCN